MSDWVPQFGELPLDDLYSILQAYRTKCPDYVRVCRSRLEYDSPQYDYMITVEGPVVGAPGDDDAAGKWLAVDDEQHDRVVLVEMTHDHLGNDQWIAVSKAGRELGEITSLEVGQDV